MSLIIIYEKELRLRRENRISLEGSSVFYNNLGDYVVRG